MMIPYGRQQITSNDIKCVIDVLNSDFLTQGPCVEKFEHKLLEITKAEYATAVNSATSALHLACLAIGVGPGDCVWTVPNTFVASANCALYCGADIDFVDIDETTFNMSIELLEQKLILAKKHNNLPKVVIPVHLSGEPCDMKAIKYLSIKYGFWVIEDASHAIGAQYSMSPVGSCAYSDITVFSFHPVKIVTSGEGGAALTNDPKLDMKMKLLRSHGITRNPEHMENPNDCAWYYEQIDLGFNYRMTDIHAALGLSQLERLSEYVERRHSIAAVYDLAFKDSNLKMPFRNSENVSALHLYIVQVDELVHAEIFHNLCAKGVGVNLHYIPVHTHPYYQRFGFRPGDFVNSETYYKKSISLPMYPTLQSDQQQYVIDELKLLVDV